MFVDFLAFLLFRTGKIRYIETERRSKLLLFGIAAGFYGAYDQINSAIKWEEIETAFYLRIDLIE